MEEKPSTRREQMVRLVSLYHKRNGTRREFCQEHGISPSALDWWRRQLQNKKKNPAFVQVRPASAQPPALPISLSGEPRVELVYPNGKHISYSGPITFDQFRELL
jgi:transposase-like protein